MTYENNWIDIELGGLQNHRVKTHTPPPPYKAQEYVVQADQSSHDPPPSGSGESKRVNRRTCNFQLSPAWLEYWSTILLLVTNLAAIGHAAFLIIHNFLVYVLYELSKFYRQDDGTHAWPSDPNIFEMKLMWAFGAIIVAQSVYGLFALGAYDPGNGFLRIVVVILSIQTVAVPALWARTRSAQGRLPRIRHFSDSGMPTARFSAS